jgi:MtN3 and saliva related transmembrane protein
MDWITIVGLIAGLLTTAGFLPQVIKISKTRKTDDISLGMYILAVAGISLWFIYGIIRWDFPIMIANGISMCLTGIILIMKLKYG